MSKLEIIQSKIRELKLYKEYLLNIKLVNELSKVKPKVKKKVR